MPYVDLRIQDVPSNTPIRIEHDGTAIVIVRTTDDVTAFHDSCPHANWRLSDGEVVNGVLQCPGHRWEFDLPSGQCLDVPVYRLKPISIIREGDRLRLVWDVPDS
jgi:nitrite reductase/ring-hydroxylating ferredoxin subunit